MSSAREHALTASTILDAERELEHELDHLSDDQRLHLAVTDGARRLNADRRFAIEVATAQALTALALAFTEAPEEAP